MLPQRDSVVSIVSFVRGIFKTWEDRLGGKERRKWECSRQSLEELDSNSGVVQVGKGHLSRVRSSRGVYGRARGTNVHWEESGEVWTLHPHTCWVLK